MSVIVRERPEQVFSSRDEANLYHIPKHFTAKEGVRLSDNLVVGKHLSSGLQGGVWRLMDNDGNEVDLVMKVSCTLLLLLPLRCAAGSHLAPFLAV